MSSLLIPAPPTASDSSKLRKHSEHQRHESPSPPPPSYRPSSLASSANHKPLSRQIDPWIYTSLILSLLSLFLLRYTHTHTNGPGPSRTSTFPFPIGHTTLNRTIATHQARSSRTPLSASLVLGSGLGLGGGLGLDALLLVILLYGTILLLLSSKERQLFQLCEITAEVPKPLTWVRLMGPTSRGSECKKNRPDEGMQDTEGEHEHEHEHRDEAGARIEDTRRSVVIWMLAVCQSGLAAVGLYAAARVVVVLRGFAESRCLVLECLGLVYAVGEMGMLVYVAVCCVVQASGRSGPGSRKSEDVNGYGRS